MSNQQGEWVTEFTKRKEAGVARNEHKAHNSRGSKRTVKEELDLAEQSRISNKMKD